MRDKKITSADVDDSIVTWIQIKKIIWHFLLILSTILIISFLSRIHKYFEGYNTFYDGYFSGVISCLFLVATLVYVVVSLVGDSQ